MPGRHQPPALLGIEVGGPAAVEEALQGLCSAAGTASADDQQSIGSGNGLGRSFDLGRVRRKTPRRFATQVFVEHQRRRDALAQDIGRDLDVHRPGRATVAERQAGCLVQIPQHVIGKAQGPRAAGHRTQDIHMRHTLQGSEIVLGDRCTAAEQQDRHPLELGVGDRRHAVGDTGTGRHHGDAEGAGQHRMGVGHMDCGPFVPHVDDAHAPLCKLIPDRLDVPTLQSENPVYAASQKKFDDEFRHCPLFRYRHDLILTLRLERNADCVWKTATALRCR